MLLLKTQLRRYRNYLAHNPEGYWFKKAYPWGWAPTGWGPFFVSLGCIALGFLILSTIAAAPSYSDQIIRLGFGLLCFGMFYYLAVTKGSPDANAASVRFWHDAQYDQEQSPVNSYVKFVTSIWTIVFLNGGLALLGFLLGFMFAVQ